MAAVHLYTRRSICLELNPNLGAFCFVFCFASLEGLRSMLALSPVARPISPRVLPDPALGPPLLLTTKMMKDRA